MLVKVSRPLKSSHVLLVEELLALSEVDWDEDEDAVRPEMGLDVYVQFAHATQRRLKSLRSQ